MKILAHAKINTTLEVYGVRADGYHELRSVVCPISLADVLDVETSADGAVATDTPYGEDDLVVRAAKALRATAGAAGARLGARVKIEKKIPVGGGLGGGSADAAAALRALNELWKLGRMTEELAEIGASVGSDVPALVWAQTLRAPVLMEGRGERVTPLPSESRDERPLVLVSPGVSVSTAEVYRRCSARTQPATGSVNDLQAAACQICPAIALVLVALTAAGAEDVMMSGSGSVVYGFAPDAAAAERIAERLGAVGAKTWVTSLLQK